MEDLSCAFTGHRLARLGFGHDENDRECQTIKALLSDWIGAFVSGGMKIFYTGMALGVDQWAASIILDMKKEHRDIRLIAVLPCETQANRWTEKQRDSYFNILAECDEVITLHNHYTRSCMLERNRYLVDHAKNLLAVYDGGARGGTSYTVNYARQKHRHITIIHPSTLKVTSSISLEALRRSGKLRLMHVED